MPPKGLLSLGKLVAYKNVVATFSCWSAMEHDAAGAAALMVIHSLILALVEKRVLDPDEIHGALEDVIASRRDGVADPAAATRGEAMLRLVMQLADDVARAPRAPLEDAAPTGRCGRR